MVTDIYGNILMIREKIAQAAHRSGRSEKVVKLVAVSKTRSVEEMEEAVRYGVDAIGENRVQEAVSKWDPSAPRSQVPWHLVGHLQKNKARKAFDIFSCVHSIDSLQLAEALQMLCNEKDRDLEILIQVNIGCDPGKFGIPVEEVPGLVEAVIRKCTMLDVSGFMTVLPLGLDEKNTRSFFAATRDLRDAMEVRFGRRFPCLSMGMSGDFVQAVMEGSTMVRIGSAIFGPRYH